MEKGTGISIKLVVVLALSVSFLIAHGAVPQNIGIDQALAAAKSSGGLGIFGSGSGNTPPGSKKGDGGLGIFSKPKPPSDRQTGSDGLGIFTKPKRPRGGESESGGLERPTEPKVSDDTQPISKQRDSLSDGLKSFRQLARSCDNPYAASVVFLKKAVKNNDPYMCVAALLHAQAAVEKNPRDPRCWFLLGDIYSKQGDNPVARQLARLSFERCLKIEPGNDLASLLLARVLLLQADYANALDILETLNRKHPRLFNSDLYKSMLGAYLLDQQLERGEKFFRELSKRDPSTSIQLCLALLLNARQQSDAAARQLKQLISTAKQNDPYAQYAEKLLKSWRSGSGSKR